MVFKDEFYGIMFTVRTSDGLWIITVTSNLFIGQAHEW